MWLCVCFFFQAEDGIRDLVRSRGLGDVYKRQHQILGMRVPAHAAVAETVALARQVNGAGAAGFVNAVLRRLSERTLAEWIGAILDPIPDPLERLAGEHPHPPWHVQAFRAPLLGHGPATAQTVADPYLDPNVQAVTDIRADEEGASWVDLAWLMGAPKGKANTLYLVVPLDDYNRLAPVLGGFLSDLKAQAYEWDVAGRQLGAPLLMLIDEAGNMPLAWLPQVASTCAGIGIQLVTIWQSLAQIEEAYGRLANSVITNHATKLFFPSASDESTLGYQSKIAGDEDVERRSWSTDTTGGRRSVSGSEQREPLVPYHVPRLAPLGQALLIHGNIPPAVVHGRKWWKDRRLRSLAKGGAPLPAQADEKRAA